jgi:hypothetical protein
MIGTANADQAGGRSGAPVATGQNRTFSDPINRPVPPMSSPVQQGYPLYPRRGPQPRSQQRTR